ncbi:MAG: UDP-N-acetylmuramoyl-tripeptide--D-alanyl-D-alanine ligase [Bacteroidetes bacterium]|nr:UDP-N-acetylmuramoyl-tripeptide--D-alanyl-D-alanine ligase [Bacteroidota bacterium]
MNKLGITLEDLFNLSTSVIYNPDVYNTSNNISIDSRTIKKNSIYVALKGEIFDGHSFVKEAVKKHANAVIINENKLNEFDSVNSTIVTVNNTLKAYGELATIRKNKLDAKVISITGSAGKTSTKEILSVLLSEKYKVHKTSANNNNHVGVPLTILSAPKSTEVLVLEHGTNHFNETEFTAGIAEPDIALITNIGDSHLEFFVNREGVYNEKSALLLAAQKNKGTVLINYDDPILKKNSGKFLNKVTYGFKGKVDIKGKILGLSAEGKSEIRIEYKNIKITVVIPLLGEANAKNYLAACSIALALGLTKKQILNASPKIKSIKGRLEIYNQKDKMIIDDTYNSSPDSMKNAVSVLNNISKYKRKILIAGDMFELGKQSKLLHESLSAELMKSKITDFYTIGKMMKHLSVKVSSKRINKKHFFTRESLAGFLTKQDFSKSVILVKGSRGMKMEDFLKTIINQKPVRLQ